MAQSNYCTMMLKISHPTEALLACDRAIAMGWSEPDIFLRKAVALQALDRPLEAEAAAQQALAVDTGSVAARAALGNLQVDRGDLAGAEASLHEARKRGEHTNLLMLAANIATARGDRNAAFEAFDRLVEGAGRMGHFRYLYALSALKLGDRVRARREIDACLSVAPDALPCRELDLKLGQ